MTIIYDKSGNFLVASLDGEEVTYKPLISEWERMAEWERSRVIALLCRSRLPSISGSTKSAKIATGANDLMKQLLSPSHYLIIAGMK